ncbi:hypothetical protein HYDPIDRAFT_93487 [Hydnomerulius pinastri MD-312]|uniref:MYND-type domain-containing protein n=1 Tax=Hydnomerulius pinastri MD-312 TaxID=994086 RepID=A0A0C9VB65_9AGAM|nr:hypothetical protein HYDPIDRAFT_93487 [Hydnomerulius pinastri MD-312]
MKPHPGKPKFIKFKSGDKGEGMPAAFMEGKTWSPKPGVKGQIHTWGLFPVAYISPVDGISMMYRTMLHQSKYLGLVGTSPWPENQFLDVLKERKREQLSQLDLAGLDERDIIIKIHMPVRNLHCYHFTDFRDGSLFGPEAIVEIWAPGIQWSHFGLQVGYDYMPDDKYMLAHLFSKVGDTIGYLYDFGDKWYHEIEVEEILPREQSYGQVKVLDGSGMCPGENMRGSFQYDVFLKEYDADSYIAQNKKKREILDTPNYKSFGKPPSLFDIEAFDISAANERLAAALASPNSVRTGAKSFKMPMAPNATDLESHFLKKGQSIKRDWEPESHGYWQETTTERKDKRSQAVCAACGKPGGQELKTCSGCRMILYCSAEHQKAHWKDVHKSQCSRKYLKK